MTRVQFLLSLLGIALVAKRPIRRCCEYAPTNLRLVTPIVAEVRMDSNTMRCLCFLDASAEITHVFVGGVSVPESDSTTFGYFRDGNELWIHMPRNAMPLGAIHAVPSIVVALEQRAALAA